MTIAAADTHQNLLDELSGGDLRSIGASDEVVTQVVQQPALFAQLVDGLLHSTDPLVRMRCADAIEKISHTHPEWLQTYQASLRTLMATPQPKEIEWHLAQLAPLLVNNESQAQAVFDILQNYLQDDSRIVQVMALTSMVTLGQQWPALRPAADQALHAAQTSSIPSVRARARQLLKSAH